jgi:hypothetical protein
MAIRHHYLWDSEAEVIIGHSKLAQISVGMESRGNLTEGKYDSSRNNAGEKSKTKWKNNIDSALPSSGIRDYAAW